MRRATIALLAATALLAACGSGGDTADTAPAAPSSTAVDPDEYAQQVVEAFRSTYPAGGDDLEDPAQTADWSAFVATLEDLQPPDGEEADHNRMVAGFQAYVDAREDAAKNCGGKGIDGTAACLPFVRAVDDQWQAALDRAYEIPGLSRATLLG